MDERGACRFDDETTARAVGAAKRAAARAGAPVGEALVLYRSRRVVVHLPSIATVARIGPADAACLAADMRELSVARRLAGKGAPIVAPSALMGAGPFVEDDLAVTLWPHIDHETRDDDDRDAVARAAAALRRVHDGLADYPGALPSYWERIAQCGELLRGATPPLALSAADRTFLLRKYEELSDRLSRFKIASAPIHGDAHMGNVFFTPDGPLWTDFETICRGPYEWDAAAMLRPAAFPGLNPELYRVLAELRRLCVVVWCSALAHDPKKRAAAEEQLASLKRGAQAWASEPRAAPA
jgi:hypothetical protein